MTCCFTSIIQVKLLDKTCDIANIFVVTRTINTSLNDNFRKTDNEPHRDACIEVSMEITIAIGWNVLNKKQCVYIL